MQETCQRGQVNLTKSHTRERKEMALTSKKSAVKSAGGSLGHMGRPSQQSLLHSVGLIPLVSALIWRVNNMIGHIGDDEPERLARERLSEVLAGLESARSALEAVLARR